MPRGRPSWAEKLRDLPQTELNTLVTDLKFSAAEHHRFHEAVTELPQPLTILQRRLWVPLARSILPLAVIFAWVGIITAAGWSIFLIFAATNTLYSTRCACAFNQPFNLFQSTSLDCTCKYEFGLATSVNASTIFSIEPDKEHCCAACERSLTCVASTFWPTNDNRSRVENCWLIDSVGMPMVNRTDAEFCKQPVRVEDGNNLLGDILAGSAVYVRLGPFIVVGVKLALVLCSGFGGWLSIRAIFDPRGAGIADGAKRQALAEERSRRLELLQKLSEPAADLLPLPASDQLLRIMTRSAAAPPQEADLHGRLEMMLRDPIDQMWEKYSSAGVMGHQAYVTFCKETTATIDTEAKSQLNVKGWNMECRVLMQQEHSPFGLDRAGFGRRYTKCSCSSLKDAAMSKVLNPNMITQLLDEAADNADGEIHVLQQQLRCKLVEIEAEIAACPCAWCQRHIHYQAQCNASGQQPIRGNWWRSPSGQSLCDAEYARLPEEERGAFSARHAYVRGIHIGAEKLASWDAIMNGTLRGNLRHVGYLRSRSIGGMNQATWDEARVALGITVKQAVWVSRMKLVFWHWSQPVAYWIVCGYYFCLLDEDQRSLAIIVAVREIFYWLCTIIAYIWACPAFVLLELGSIKAGPNEPWWRLNRSELSHWAIYVFAPHYFVTTCVARRYAPTTKGSSTIAFIVLGFELFADGASLFALWSLLKMDKAPFALAIGYCLTVGGFVIMMGGLGWPALACAWTGHEMANKALQKFGFCQRIYLGVVGVAICGAAAFGVVVLVITPFYIA
jgi:hypothetical protein